MPKLSGLSPKQKRFVAEYAVSGNGSHAARSAGYKPKAARQMSAQNLAKPAIKFALAQELARLGEDISPDRVKRRLSEISHASQSAGQFGPAVRAEELIGKAVGMWVEQTINLNGTMSDAHISALIELAQKRQAERLDHEPSK